MARKLIVYSLMIFYVAFQLRPLTVVISDVLAHTFFRVQHMATIHYENGKYHVHADLKAIADEERCSGKENQATLKKTSESPLHTINTFRVQFDSVFLTLTASLVAAPGILPGCKQIEVPPPRA